MNEEILSLPSLVDTMAVTGGGISGALHATKLRMDLVGIAFVAICTGVGGGAIRDIILGQDVPVFLIRNFVGMAAIGAVAGYFFAKLVSELQPAIFVMDTLLIGIWVVIGAEKALAVGLSYNAAAFLGLTTAIGGGMMRDVLCRQVPTALMPGQWVAGAAIVAALIFVSVDGLLGNRVLAEVTAIAGATTLRALSARYKWVTPDALTASQRLYEWLGLRRRPSQPALPAGDRPQTP